MKGRAFLFAITATLVVGMTATTSADDGQRLFRSISSGPGQVGGPEPEGKHLSVDMMDFYVPAQQSDGTLTTIEYINADDQLVFTSDFAKPLFGFYIHGPVITFATPATSGFPGHGRRDAFVSMSLDDGQTWKPVNLSNSANKSSFTTTTPIPDPANPPPQCASNSTTPGIDVASYNPPPPTLTVQGAGAIPGSMVEVRDCNTHIPIGTAHVKGNGRFQLKVRRVTEAPCCVQAGYSETNTWGPCFPVEGAPEDCDVPPIDAYPGDVINGAFAVSANRAFAAWHSKYCQDGFPAWSSEYDVETVANYLGINTAVDLYLTDLFVVGGSQGSVDYREQEEFPGEYDAIGEVPYSCLWTARGVLRKDPENPGTTEIVWTQAERLTSGRRDVNRIEVGCVTNAGCAVTWQEDPEGLSPKGDEGPDSRWSGGITASQTDVWYSFIRWEDFDIVDNNGTFMPLADLPDTILGTNRPRPAVPMMVAARITNNARCGIPVTGLEETYWNDAFAAPYLIPDQCIDTVEIPLGPQGELFPICVADTNRSGTGDLGDTPNVANTASSRPRLNLQPRDSDGDGVTDDAWVISYSEETKGLGRYGFDTTVAWDFNLDNTGVYCGDPDVSLTDDCFAADIGKNVKWHTFAMGTPQTSVLDGVSADQKDFSLVNNLVVQGAQINQPEVNWRTGTFYPPMSTTEMWDFGGVYNYLIFNSEIARHPIPMTQSVAKATTQPATAGHVAFSEWKQGIVEQGGPADNMARRFVADADINQAEENPYAYANMKCEYTDDDGNLHDGVMFFTDGENPLYPQGLCMAPAINLSARTPCLFGTDGYGDEGSPCSDLALVCEEVEGYGQLCSADDNPPVSLDSLENPQNILCPWDASSAIQDKLLSWYQCPGWNGVDCSNAGNSGSSTIPGACGTEVASVILGSNLNDQSWYLPMEVSKAHRGFLDGDFVMTMHAWSPNCSDNALGDDRYELYVRRSFDGGITWTTTPASYTGTDGLTVNGVGTTTCETWRDGVTPSHICTCYEAGDPEQSRNLSLQMSMAFTILDGRYTPTRGSMLNTAPDWADNWLQFMPNAGNRPDPTDDRKASRYFIVYENGDNTTTAAGEAEPLDLGYGRAEVYGDHYTVWTEIDTGYSTIDDCFPNNPYGITRFLWAAGTGFCNELDELEEAPNDRSEEASITSSAYGDFIYSLWRLYPNSTVGRSDAWFRRLWYLDDYIWRYAPPGPGQ